MTRLHRHGLPRLVTAIAIVAFVLVTWLLASATGPPTSRPAAGGSEDSPYVEGEVLVKFKHGSTETARRSVRSTLGAKRMRRLGRSVEHLRLGSGRTTLAAIERLRRHPDVEFAEPNYLVSIDKVPDDLRFVELYGLQNTGQTGGDPDSDIDADLAWDLTTGTHDVIVGIIDSGVDYHHPDLAANIWTNPGEIPGNGIDDDGNGYVDDVHGWDFVNDDNDPFDDHGHGTHVAGTVGAVGDNGRGVTGVAWKVSIVPLKFIAADGFGTTVDAVAAIEYATSIGADITNNSWGGGAYSQTMAGAILDAADAEVLFVAAAGNHGFSNDLLPHYPSGYESPNVIAVTMLNHRDVRPLQANLGVRTVDLGAPGVNILSTYPGGVYNFQSGSSMATPHVSGAAALVRTLAPHIGVVELKALLLDNVDPVVSLTGITVTGGRLNAFRSLSDRDVVDPGAIDDLVTGAATSNSIFLSWTAVGDDGNEGTASVYELRHATWPIDDSSFPLATRVWDTPPAQPPGSTETHEVRGLSPGTLHYFAIRAVDEWGNKGPVSNIADGTTLPAPTLASSPAAFHFDLFAGQTEARTLNVSNVGVGTLDWSVGTMDDVPWLKIAPTEGRLTTGAAQQITLTVDTRGLAPGSHGADVRLNSNDPLRPVVDHPLTLELTSAPAIEVAPSSIDFGEVFVGASATVTLEIGNFGTESLVVGEMTWMDGAVDVIPSFVTVPVGESRVVEISFTPSLPAALDDVLTIPSDAPNAPAIEVPLHATSALPPGIDVTPASIDETLLARTTVTRSMRIHNPGVSPLVATLFFVPGANPGTLLSSPLVNGGFESGDFGGWEATQNDVFGFFPWTVTEADGGWFENSSPVEGSFSALNGFEGGGGLEYDLVQLLDIPAGVTRAQLTYFDRIQWHDQGIPALLSRIYQGTIEDPDKTILSVIVREEYLFDGSGYNDLGWRRRTTDLTPFAGQTVRLHMREYVRQGLTGPGQVEFDDFRIDIEGFPDWFRPDPKELTVPPGEFVDVEVILDATDLLAKDLDGFIGIATNVPSTPELMVPVRLTVFGLPQIEIGGESIVLESSADYSSAGALTEHSLPVSVPPGGEGTIELTLVGDFGGHGEGATLSIEGQGIGAAGNTGADCVPATTRFALSAEDLVGFAADGSIDVSVQNTVSVGPYCNPNRHLVRLTYEASSQRLDFGSVYVGAGRSLAVTIANVGTAPLRVGSIASDHPSFVPSFDATTLEIGESTRLDVVLAPGAAGTLSGTLRLMSDDPATPLIEIELLGTGVIPPTTVVDPLAIDLRLPVGGRRTENLLVSNVGGESLEFSTTITTAAGSFVAVAPVAGTVLPGQSVVLDVLIDSAGLAPGLYAASIDIIGNNPATVPVTVPVELTLDDAPDIAVHGRPITVTSGADFSGDGAASAHVLAVEATPFGAGILRLIAIGDFGDPDETATVTAEGVVLGNLGGFGQDCLPVLADFELDASTLGRLAADGIIEATVRNSATVSDGCVANSHTLRLTYDESAEPLDLGSRFVGSGAEQQLIIDNAGTQPLEITSIVSTSDAFSVAGEPFTVAPAQSHAVVVRFTANSGGLLTGTLEIASNDPDEPVAIVALRGTGVEPPAIDVDPPALGLSLGSGSSESVLLTVRNNGTGPLELDVAIEPTSARFVSIVAAPDSVPAGESAPIQLEVDAAFLFAGTYEAVVVLTTNDPATPRVVVPLTLEVTGAPALSPSTERLDFGETLIGVEKELWLGLVNDGTAPLEIDPITTNPTDFVIDTDALSLAPGTATSLRVGYRPSLTGTVDGSLQLNSNDPSRPQITITLTGTGVAPPAIAVAPTSLDVTAESGSADIRTFRIANDGDSPLEFDVLVRPQAIPSDAVRGEPAADRFESIAAAPGPLACLVGDPLQRHLYGQARGGTAFYRYTAATDSWTATADAPLAAGTACGVALLDGKIYTSYAGGSELGAYDPATNSWRTLAAPLADTVVLASDGDRFLYQVRGTVGRKLDPVSGMIDRIAAPPFAFDPLGSLSGLDGVLLGHQGGPGTLVAAYETVTDGWTLLTASPGAAEPGGAIDPIHRTYVLGGPQGSGELYRYSIDAGSWETVAASTPTAGGRGLAWLPDPHAGFYSAGGDADFLHWLTEPAFVAVAPHTGTVAPGGAIDVEATFDATRLYAGAFEAEIEISSNDVTTPLQVVSSRLTVTGVPQMSPAADRLDFGEVYVGIARELPLVIENLGTDQLHVASISSALAQVVAIPDSLTVAPGASETIAIRLTADGAGAIDGSLIISGNAPATPTASVAVSGFGLEPSRLDLSPSSLDTTLPDGERLVRTLTLSNPGLATLVFSLGVSPGNAPFVTLATTSGSVLPGGSIALDVAFDSTTVPLGTHAAEIRLATNDPLRPLVVIPSSLTVVGVPRIALGGALVTLESSATYAKNRMSTVHRFTGEVAPSGSGTLGLWAEGDFGNPGETATVVAEGHVLGQVGATGADCSIAEGQFAVDADDLAAIAQDGTIEIVVQNSPDIHMFCPVNRHTIRLSYVGSTELMNFGTVFLGTSRDLTLVAENLGNAPLEVGPISSDATEFASVASSISVAPGTSETITVSFSPSSVDSFAAVLTVPTNDPNVPAIQLDLAGIGARAPMLVTDPASLEIELDEGGSTTQSLRLINAGAGPLDYSLSVLPPEATYVQLGSVGGTLPAQGEATVRIDVDVNGLPPGVIAASLEIVSNDPDRPVVQLPLTLNIAGAADISFVGERVTLESVVEFDSSGALTHHEIPITIPPAGDGRFEVVGDGDFGASFEWAVVTVEARHIGTIGGVGADCVPTFGIFPVDADTVAAFVDDGVVSIEVQNSANVDPLCSVNAHTVRLSYDAQRDSLDYGVVFVGQTATRSTTLLNFGSETLEVHLISTDVAAFSPSTTSVTLLPGESETVAIAFAPDAAGRFAGLLSVESNDPDTPRLTIPLSATGAEPPVFGISASSIATTLPEGERRTSPLTVTNSGASPLELSVELLPPEGFRADYTLFGTDAGGSNLYTIDPATGEVTFIGFMGVAAPSLAVDPTSGLMYAGQGGGTAALYTVDPATGIVSFVGYSGSGALAAMDFDTHGTLYAAVNFTDGQGTGGDSLAIIDKQTGAAKIIGPFGDGIGTRDGLPGIAGLAFHPFTGVLYAASAKNAATVGPPALYVIDPITGDATLVGPVEDLQGVAVPGGVGSLQFDLDGVLFGGTGRGTGNLIRIYPATGIYTLIGHSVPAALGALALRANPPDLSFLSVTPLTVTVPPFDTLDLQVTLDARALAPGRIDARIAIETNDPDSALVTIPVELTVLGIPDIAIPGETVSLESTEDFTGAGGVTFHELDVSAPAAGGAVLEFTADGDFGDASEVARLFVDGLRIGTVGHIGSDCFPATGTIALAASDFAGLAADGVLDIEVANSPTVFAFCVLNRHTLRLSYDLPLERLDFGTVYLGYERTLPVVIKNDGRAELHVVSITVDDPAITLDTSAATVPPFGAVTVSARYVPQSERALSGSLRIESDDPDEPSISIELAGAALGAPVAEVDPPAVKAALPPLANAGTTRTVRLRNTGESDLVWTADLYENLAPPQVVQEWNALPKGDESDNGDGGVAIEHSGGPDAFGYRFEDSREPGGPGFDWVDIETTGLAIPLANDDANSGPVRLGFDFPFYGTDFGFLYVSANGWLSFTSDSTSYSNPDSLPNAGFSVPENLIAPFWDDLDMGDGTVTYFGDDTRFIVQYTAADRFASPARLTFQVILYPSGKIVFQYLSMEGTLDSATIGMQNQDRTIGLLVAYNEPYVGDRLAVEFTPVAAWVTATPLAGSVPPGGFDEIGLAFDASDLDDGDHSAVLLIRSNDPARDEIAVPIGLHVGVIDLERFAIYPETINLSSRGRTIRAAIQLPAPFDPGDVVPASVSLYGELFAEPGSLEIADTNGDGIDEAILRFDRQAFADVVPDGTLVPVTITGEVDGQTWFEGTTQVRIRRRSAGR